MNKGIRENCGRFVLLLRVLPENKVFSAKTQRFFTTKGHKAGTKAHKDRRQSD